MRYFYITWACLFLLVWLFIYIKRKDLHREMFHISILGGFLGFIAEHTNIIDWWRPLTITGTALGIEDFIIGFAITGIAATIYEVITSRKLKTDKHYRESRSSSFFLLFLPVSYLILFFIFGLGSLYSLLGACGLGLGYMLFNRRGLLQDSLFSGALLLVLGSTFYLMLSFVFPGYIQAFWFLPPVWYSKLFLGIPVAEFIWFFAVGMYFGPLYEFIKGKRLVRD